jgi:hypothetical protein
LLDALYPPPSASSLEQYERAKHRDLPHLARAELRRELERLRLRLLLDDGPGRWFIERLSKLERAINAAAR